MNGHVTHAIVLAALSGAVACGHNVSSAGPSPADQPGAVSTTSSPLSSGAANGGPGRASSASASSPAVPSGTVIVSNMNDNTATVIDAASGRVVATLPTGEGPHEVATSHDGRLALVSNYGVRGKPGNSLTVIDVARAEVERTIDLGAHQRPHGMAFLPGDTLVAITRETDKEVHLVDVRTGALVATLPTNGRTTHMIGLARDGSRLVTSNISDNSISVVSLTARGTPTAPRVIPVARQPEGIAITPDGRTAWVGSNRDSVVLVVDLTNGYPVDTLRNFGLPYRVAVSPDGRRVVITDPAKGQVRIVDAATHAGLFTIDIPRDSILATAEIKDSPSPEGVTIAPDSRYAFVTLQGRNRMVTIDLERGTIVGWATTGTWSDGIAFSPVVARRAP